jgi:predicted ABC-type ATPase
MKTFINLRGTNGSGKSTLARCFLGENDAEVTLTTFETPKGKVKPIIGYVNPDLNSCVVGDYSTMAGGLDKVKTFALQFEAIEAALALDDVEVVVAEGVLASTVLGSWAEHAKKLKKELGHRVIWAFFETPVEHCIERIYSRNGGKPIKEDLVRGKWEQIDRVRQKALARPWIEVVALPFGLEQKALWELLGW